MIKEFHRPNFCPGTYKVSLLSLYTGQFKEESYYSIMPLSLSIKDLRIGLISTQMTLSQHLKIGDPKI
jgi:hypothetical protein